MTSAAPAHDLRTLIVHARRILVPGAVEFTLVDPDGRALEPASPGAHLTVRTPAGAMRNYSVTNPGDPKRYVIAVKIERAGRGGSLSMAEHLNEGDALAASAPVNDFPLVPAPAYLLIAGGIGITPILALARELAATARPFRLVYCTRSPELTPYAEAVAALAGHGDITVHHDDGDPDRIYDLWPLLETPDETHVYCCGPRPMMEDVEGMVGHWPEDAVHREDFATDVRAVREDDRPFTVRNERTGETIQIPADATILETLRAHGHQLPSSCESGTCGTCRTRLVAGQADHRDLVLAPDEREAAIMICVSRAAGDELVLDW